MQYLDEKLIEARQGEQVMPFERLEQEEAVSVTHCRDTSAATTGSAAIEISK